MKNVFQMRKINSNNKSYLSKTVEPKAMKFMIPPSMSLPT